MKPKKESEEEQIVRLLTGYKELKRRDFHKQIRPNSHVRYAVDNVLKYGGTVVSVDETHMVLRNFIKRFSWTVSLVQSKLRVFLKT